MTELTQSEIIAMIDEEMKDAHKLQRYPVASVASYYEGAEDCLRSIKRKILTGKKG